jgi:hypothetical protein
MRVEQLEGEKHRGLWAAAASGAADWSTAAEAPALISASGAAEAAPAVVIPALAAVAKGAESRVSAAASAEARLRGSLPH